jgi:glycosyltransferase involved in cell wall biosynthesis
MRSESAKIIVENTDDLEVFKRHVSNNSNIITVIPGVGVDVNVFYPYNKKNSETLKVAMVSRILHDKGVDEFRVSAIALKDKYPNVEFILAGTIDPTNPSSYSTYELDEIVNEGVIKLLGHVENVACFLRSIDIFLLPSYREGFPRAIMEASASGLPVVTTDVVGCRSAIIHNETGILIKSRDEQALIDATEKLILSSELRVAMGMKGRNLAKKEFDEKMLSIAHADIWEK